MRNGKVISVGIGLIMTLLGFVGGLAYTSGQDATRLTQVEDTLAAHVVWAEQRSATLTQTEQSMSNTALAMQQMAGDIQAMQKDVREIRDYYLRSKP